ncbi:MAG: N-acetylmuramoyl-L-alanine amidase [Gammaproteobacteria bacterium]|nr:N-acetylmuramoyl-L-alanine amidase [Gammaproteobacteria bacterium]
MTAVLCLLAQCAFAADVVGVRMWPAPGQTRVVLDISDSVDYEVFAIQNPSRIVCDIKNVRNIADLKLPGVDPNIISGLRYARHGAHDLRIVLDLRKDVEIQNSLLSPHDKFGHRLVLDLIDTAPPQVAVDKPAPVRSGQPRDLVVAIDAGHGGEDVGAIGRTGSYEKVITLAMARELARLVNAEPGMRAVLIRDGDYYVGLRKRSMLAREHKADLFVSLHADAFRDPNVSGGSVYVLSRSGASSEAARWLAESENSSDLIGGVTLGDKDEMLKTVLLDLSQSAAIDGSLDAAEHVLGKMRTVGKVHKRNVERAGFAVLKSPDIPSLLVELAFISNPTEERRLNDTAFRRQMALALRDGIRSYFQTHAPPGTLVAAREHKVAPGDTVSGLARRYAVQASDIMLANNMRGDTLHVGEVLRIP